MINVKWSFGLVLFIFVVVSCAPTGGVLSKSGRTNVQTSKYVDGKVTSIDGSTAVIQVRYPEYDSSTMPFTNRVAQKVIDKSFLLENSSTMIGEQAVLVVEIRDDTLTVQCTDSPAFAVGDEIKINVPKKVIAATDFEVIRGRDKSIGVISMESVTTALVNSGQFNVVERKKLETILKELKIGLSGLTDSRTAKEIGKLLQADMILTGSFANLGGYWNVNLRLINVSTGLIVAAFEEKATFKDIKPDAVRDMSNINAHFEDHFNAHNFIIGTIQLKNGSLRSVFIDRSTGANGTVSSLCMRYTLPSQGGLGLLNIKKRDLSSYSGASFYAKADHGTTVAFGVHDSNREDIAETETWFALFPVETSWHRYEIKFTDLALSNNAAVRNPKGDGCLNLDLVDRIHFGVTTRQNLPKSQGSIWIDEFNFY